MDGTVKFIKWEETGSGVSVKHGSGSMANIIIANWEWFFLRVHRPFSESADYNYAFVFRK